MPVNAFCMPWPGAVCAKAENFASHVLAQGAAMPMIGPFTAIRATRGGDVNRIILVLTAVFLAMPGVAWAASAGLELNAPLPAFELPMPEDARNRQYLGLDGSRETFRIGDLGAETVIVQIFSMYCPSCQREAPKVNELYLLIQNDPQLRGRVKMIGIGVGNSAFEVDYFRKSYAIAFPLFPDEDFAIHKLCGEVRTPYFIAVKTVPGGEPVVFHTHLGGFDTPRAFLDDILKRRAAAGGAS